MCKGKGMCLDCAKTLDDLGLLRVGLHSRAGSHLFVLSSYSMLSLYAELVTRPACTPSMSPRSLRIFRQEAPDSSASTPPLPSEAQCILSRLILGLTRAD